MRSLFCLQDALEGEHKLRTQAFGLLLSISHLDTLRILFATIDRENLCSFARHCQLTKIAKTTLARMLFDCKCWRSAEEHAYVIVTITSLSCVNMDTFLLRLVNERLANEDIISVYSRQLVVLYWWRVSLRLKRAECHPATGGCDLVFAALSYTEILYKLL